MGGRGEGGAGCGRMHTELLNPVLLYRPYSLAAVPGDVGVRLKGVLAQHTAADRDMMLRQIEALKNARQEAEVAKQQVARLQDELTLAMAELGDVRKYHNDALARLRCVREARMASDRCVVA